MLQVVDGGMQQRKQKTIVRPLKRLNQGPDMVRMRWLHASYSSQNHRKNGCVAELWKYACHCLENMHIFIVLDVHFMQND